MKIGYSAEKESELVSLINTLTPYETIRKQHEDAERAVSRLEGEIISRKTIECCIDAPDRETYRIVVDGKKVGGVILRIDKETHHNELEILFTIPDEHSKGIGYGAWQAVEALHPETVVWETCTPYFEKRNIHF